MIIGVPTEILDHESRVSLHPGGVESLVHEGHRVLVQSGAGQSSGFSDADYIAGGAEIVASAAEAYHAAEMVVKVKEPQPNEFGYLRPGLLLFTYLHLAAAEPLTRVLLEKRVTAVAYETVQRPGGGLPLLTPMSEVAGRMAVQIGAHYLEITQGGVGCSSAGCPACVRPASWWSAGGRWARTPPRWLWGSARGSR